MAAKMSRTGVTVRVFLSRDYRRLPLDASGADDTNKYLINLGKGEVLDIQTIVGGLP